MTSPFSVFPPAQSDSLSDPNTLFDYLYKPDSEIVESIDNVWNEFEGNGNTGPGAADAMNSAMTPSQPSIAPWMLSKSTQDVQDTAAECSSNLPGEEMEHTDDRQGEGATLQAPTFQAENHASVSQVEWQSTNDLEVVPHNDVLGPTHFYIESLNPANPADAEGEPQHNTSTSGTPEKTYSPMTTERLLQEFLTDYSGQYNSHENDASAVPMEGVVSSAETATSDYTTQTVQPAGNISRGFEQHSTHVQSGTPSQSTAGHPPAPAVNQPHEIALPARSNTVAPAHFPQDATYQPQAQPPQQHFAPQSHAYRQVVQHGTHAVQPAVYTSPQQSQQHGQSQAPSQATQYHPPGVRTSQQYLVAQSHPPGIQASQQHPVVPSYPGMQILNNYVYAVAGRVPPVGATPAPQHNVPQQQALFYNLPQFMQGSSTNGVALNTQYSSSSGVYPTATVGWPGGSSTMPPVQLHKQRSNTTTPAPPQKSTQDRVPIPHPSFPQPSVPQASFPQPPLPQSSPPKPTYPQHPYPQSSYPQSSHPTASYPQPPFPQSSPANAPNPQSLPPQPAYPQSSPPNPSLTQSSIPQSSPANLSDPQPSPANPSHPQTSFPQYSIPQYSFPQYSYPFPSVPSTQPLSSLPPFSLVPPHPVLSNKRKERAGPQRTGRPSCRYSPFPGETDVDGEDDSPPKRYPAPYRLEHGKYVCTYTGPAGTAQTIPCGRISSGRDRRARSRHLATHAAKEEELIEKNLITREQAVALEWVSKIVVTCDKPGCDFSLAVWRTDNVRRNHCVLSHPEDIPKIRVRNPPFQMTASSSQSVLQYTSAPDGAEGAFNDFSSQDGEAFAGAQGVGVEGSQNLGNAEETAGPNEQMWNDWGRRTDN